MRALGRYVWNVLVWLDQGVNVLAGFALNLILKPLHQFGYPDETLSSVFAKNVGSGTCRFCAFMCNLLDWIDPNHCKKNIEPDEGGTNN